jgi:hypothetical protein
MIRLFTLLLLVIASANVLPQSPAPERKEKSCSEHPQLVGRCFTVHGRLSIYNGSPALRIWKLGTRRVLGISDQRFSVAGYRNVPVDIERQINQDVAIFGDFLVCPFTRSKPREMQLVCIETGKNLVIRKQAP